MSTEVRSSHSFLDAAAGAQALPDSGFLNNMNTLDVTLRGPQGGGGDGGEKERGEHSRHGEEKRQEQEQTAAVPNYTILDSWFSPPCSSGTPITIISSQARYNTLTYSHRHTTHLPPQHTPAGPYSERRQLAASGVVLDPLKDQHGMIDCIIEYDTRGGGGRGGGRRGGGGGGVAASSQKTICPNLPTSQEYKNIYQTEMGEWSSERWGGGGGEVELSLAENLAVELNRRVEYVEMATVMEKEVMFCLCVCVSVYPPFCPSIYIYIFRRVT